MELSSWSAMCSSSSLSTTGSWRNSIEFDQLHCRIKGCYRYFIINLSNSLSIPVAMFYLQFTCWTEARSYEWGLWREQKHEELTQVVPSGGLSGVSWRQSQEEQAMETPRSSDCPDIVYQMVTLSILISKRRIQKYLLCNLVDFSIKWWLGSFCVH